MSLSFENLRTVDSEGFWWTEPESVAYLKQAVVCLPKILQEVCQVVPRDPIEYIAKLLYKQMDCELYFYDQAIVNKELRLVYLELKREKAKRRSHIKELKRQISDLRVALEEDKAHQAEVWRERARSVRVEKKIEMQKMRAARKLTMRAGRITDQIREAGSSSAISSMSPKKSSSRGGISPKSMISSTGGSMSPKSNRSSSRGSKTPRKTSPDTSSWSSFLSSPSERRSAVTKTSKPVLEDLHPSVQHKRSSVRNPQLSFKQEDLTKARGSDSGKETEEVMGGAERSTRRNSERRREANAKRESDKRREEEARRESDRTREEEARIERRREEEARIERRREEEARRERSREEDARRESDGRREEEARRKRRREEDARRERRREEDARRESDRRREEDARGESDRRREEEARRKFDRSREEDARGESDRRREEDARGESDRRREEDARGESDRRREEEARRKFDRSREEGARGESDRRREEDARRESDRRREEEARRKFARSREDARGESDRRREEEARRESDRRREEEARRKFGRSREEDARGESDRRREEEARRESDRRREEEARRERRREEEARREFVKRREEEAKRESDRRREEEARRESVKRREDVPTVVSQTSTTKQSISEQESSTDRVEEDKEGVHLSDDEEDDVWISGEDEFDQEGEDAGVSKLSDDEDWSVKRITDSENYVVQSSDTEAIIEDFKSASTELSDDMFRTEWSSKTRKVVERSTVDDHDNYDSLDLDQVVENMSDDADDTLNMLSKISMAAVEHEEHSRRRKSSDPDFMAYSTMMSGPISPDQGSGKVDKSDLDVARKKSSDFSRRSSVSRRPSSRKSSHLQSPLDISAKSTSRTSATRLPTTYETDTSMEKRLLPDKRWFKRAEKKLVPVPCQWVLAEPRVLVCQHPILGEIRSQLPHGRFVVEAADQWDSRGYRGEVMYDPELYTVLDPHADDDIYSSRMKIWMGDDWAPTDYNIRSCGSGSNEDNGTDLESE